MEEKKPSMKLNEMQLNKNQDVKEQMMKFQVAATKTIFRPPMKPKKITMWLREKAISYIRKTDPYERRFMVIHHNTKSKLLHPILRLFQRMMRGYAIKGIEDIPAEPHNNHLRIFYHCWIKSLDQFWTKFVYRLPGRVDTKKFPTAKEYLDYIKNKRDGFQDNESHARRKLLIDLWMTEITEDTADREWLNMFMLNLYHELHAHYKGKVPRPGDQPLYDSGGPFNPQYFLTWGNEPLWVPIPTNELDGV